MSSSIKKLLQSLYWVQRRIEVDSRRLEMMRLKVGGGIGIDYTKQHICGGVAPNMGSDVIAIVGLEERLKASIQKRNKIAHKVLRIIDGVNDERLQLLLVMRYRDFKSWEEIAKEMNYSDRGIQKLHGQALKAASLVWLSQKFREEDEKCAVKCTKVQ